MITILLLIIYLSFIGLGLPDSLFGSSWPVMHDQLEVSLSFAGIVTIVVSLGTIISSLLSDRLTRRFGAGLVTATSILLTSVALIGISFSRDFILVVLFSIPLGIGAGSVDAALNNYVALHYSSRQMSWLHCFWGVGASISPFIISYFLNKNLRWDQGYLTIGIILLVISFILFLSLPLWKKNNNSLQIQPQDQPAKSLFEIIKMPGVIFVLLAFFCYCAAESTTFSWASSYLAIGEKFDVESAARYASMFYLGMTTSRFVTGFFADKVGDKNMIRVSSIVAILSSIMLVSPFDNNIISVIFLFVLGIGCGPIYPAIIHSTPKVFGKENSQAVIGIQMAFAYTGSTLMPPLFGLIANNIDISYFSLYLLVLFTFSYLLIEILNAIKKKKTD